MSEEEYGQVQEDLEQLGRHFVDECFAADVSLERLVIQYATDGMLMLTVTERGELPGETLCIERGF